MDNLRPIDVLSMTLAALITGGFFGITTLAIGALAGWISADLIAAMVGAAAALCTWMGLLQRFLRVTAMMAGIDLEPPAERTLRVEVASDGGRSISIASLPIGAEALRVFAVSLLSGGSATESAWLGSGVFRNRGEFVRFRDELVRRHWLAWNSPGTPARGLVLTRTGKSVFEYLTQNGSGG